MEIDLSKALGPNDCIICGTPLDNHDETKCLAVVDTWKPTGIPALSQTDNNKITDR